MNKKSNKNIIEFDLNKLFNFFWDGKIIILLTILISIMIGIGVNYNTQLPVSYNISLDVKPSKKLEFIKFVPINKYLTEIDHASFYGRFESEFLDYEELISILKKNAYVKERLSQAPIKNNQKILYAIAKKFTYEAEITEVYENTKNDYNSLKFEWHDIDEATQMLIEVMDLTIENVKKSFFDEWDFLYQLRKDEILAGDSKRITFLKEQSAIAKELNLTDNAASIFNLSESSVSFNNNFSSFAYYLRGYKAIEKEISLIANREYRELSNLEKEIDNLKNSDINWIDYNLFLLDVETINSSKNNNLFTMAILGLIIGVLFVFISNARRTSKKY